MKFFLRNLLPCGRYSNIVDENNENFYRVGIICCEIYETKNISFHFIKTSNVILVKVIPTKIGELFRFIGKSKLSGFICYLLLCTCNQYIAIKGYASSQIWSM